MSFLINPYVHSSDPLAGQVLLWIKGNGENNSTAIIDESGNNVSLTVYSPTRISTAQSIHGGSSILFGGGYIGTPATGSLRFTTQSFTWESWIYPTSIGVNGNSIISTARANAGGNFGHFLQVFSNGIRFRDWTGANGAFLSGTISLNNWYHVACTKNGATARVWVNGIEGTSGSFNATNFPHTEFQIGRSFNDGGYAPVFQGYQQAIRITSGLRYTGNFNPLTDTYLF